VWMLLLVLSVFTVVCETLPLKRGNLVYGVNMLTQSFSQYGKRLSAENLRMLDVESDWRKTEQDKTVFVVCLRTNTQQQSFYGPLSGTTRVSRYQKKHSPTHHPASSIY